jgi:uncharacterized surface protein with fasciclin (FAS1) repeats
LAYFKQQESYIMRVFNSFRLLTVVFLAGSIGINGTALAGAHSQPAAPATANIVDTAVAAGSFTTLVAALQAADLVGALKGEGPFTVFAPNDEAFGKLWEGTLDNLLKPENKEKLQSLLMHHVVPGKIMSGDLSGTVKAETLQGASLTIVASSSGVKVDKSNVVAVDIEASNGVIHVIDQVMLPPVN